MNIQPAMNRAAIALQNRSEAVDQPARADAAFSGELDSLLPWPEERGGDNGDLASAAEDEDGSRDEPALRPAPIPLPHFLFTQALPPAQARSEEPAVVRQSLIDGQSAAPDKQSTPRLIRIQNPQGAASDLEVESPDSELVETPTPLEREEAMAPARPAPAKRSEPLDRPLQLEIMESRTENSPMATRQSAEHRGHQYADDIEPSKATANALSEIRGIRPVQESSAMLPVAQRDGLTSPALDQALLHLRPVVTEAQRVLQLLEQTGERGPVVRHLQIKLHPEELGELRITLRLSRDELDLRIEADSEWAASDLERDRPLLDRLLQMAGPATEPVRVDIRIGRLEPAERAAGQARPEFFEAAAGGFGGAPGGSHRENRLLTEKEARNDSSQVEAADPAGSRGLYL